MEISLNIEVTLCYSALNQQCPMTTVEKSNRTAHLKKKKTKILTFIHIGIPILKVPVSHKHQASTLNISINGGLSAPISQASQTQ